MDHVKL